ncbi:MAG: hypothetical protein BWY80_00915 [Firmicutes bacterium ADurb.Bin456]|nr:MAG: hypothetical protein BWY80_00915 [Firmicutes bacterium ADurb.Bin456]
MYTPHRATVRRTSLSAGSTACRLSHRWTPGGVLPGKAVFSPANFTWTPTRRFWRNCSAGDICCIKLRCNTSSPIAGAVKNRYFSGLQSSGLPPLTVSARLLWTQFARCAGSRPGVKSASIAWLPTGAIGAFPVSAAGGCPFLFFTARPAAKS